MRSAMRQLFTKMRQVEKNLKKVDTGEKATKKNHEPSDAESEDDIRTPPKKLKSKVTKAKAIPDESGSESD